MTMKTIGILWLMLAQTLAAQSTVDQAVHLLQQGDLAMAEKNLHAAAGKGNPEAAFYLSLIKLFGDNQDAAQGIELLYQAVEAGLPVALDTLAGYHLHGDFVEQDHHKALMYYRLAADCGYGPSQFNCGIMLKNGERTPLDLENAFVYLALAALNINDLGDVTQDAAKYRDEVAQKLTSAMYQNALIKLNKLL